MILFQFSLGEYLEGVFGREFERDTTVVVYSPNYYRNLTSVLRNTSRE